MKEIHNSNFGIYLSVDSTGVNLGAVRVWGKKSNKDIRSQVVHFFFLVTNQTH